MKKIYSIIAGLLMTASVFAQAPEKMSYQAVVRDGSNNLVASTAVGMQISILQGTSSGSAVYVETQTPTTNANGLVSLEIGSGTVVSGTFASIDWANGPYFIKTETDPTGGTNYTITGTSQLLSVPYALYAKTASALSSNEILSFSINSNVSQSYVMMDTVSVIAGKVVQISGYVQTTGSDCAVQLYDLTNGQWVNAHHTVWTLYEEPGIGFNHYIGTSGSIVPYKQIMHFTSYFIPNYNFELQVRAKELSATHLDGVCEACVIVKQ